MSETKQSSSIESTVDIWIVSLDTDKTRKTKGSDTGYQVYFELSEAPARAWRNIFEREWKDLNPRQPHVWQEAVIDRGFLVMHCALPEVTAHLPVLKKAVTATNKAHDQYVHEQATEQARIEDAWKQERQAVDVMVGSLHFEKPRLN